MSYILIIKFNKCCPLWHICFFIFAHNRKSNLTKFNEMLVEIILCSWNGKVSNKYLVQMILLLFLFLYLQIFWFLLLFWFFFVLNLLFLRNLFFLLLVLFFNIFLTLWMITFLFYLFFIDLFLFQFFCHKIFFGNR